MKYLYTIILRGPVIIALTRSFLRQEVPKVPIEGGLESFKSSLGITTR